MTSFGVAYELLEAFCEKLLRIFHPLASSSSSNVLWFLHSKKENIRKSSHFSKRFLRKIKAFEALEFLKKN